MPASNSRYSHRRYAHCAHCNAIHVYVVFSSATKHRLRNQRCRSCGSELGRGANKRAVALKRAEKAAAAAKRQLQRSRLGGRSGRSQGVGEIAATLVR